MKKKKPLIILAAIAAVVIVAVVVISQSSNWSTLSYEAVVTLCRCNTEDEIGILAANINNLYQTLLQTISDLEQEVHKVERAEMQKTDFLRAASHELKTPITAVNIILENMILGVGKYKDRDTYLAKCKVMTERLASMIKEILDTSKLDTYGQQEVIEIDLAQAVIAVCDPFRVIAKSNGINFHVDMSDSFNVSFATGHLERVISNLLSNQCACGRHRAGGGKEGGETA